MISTVIREGVIVNTTRSQRLCRNFNSDDVKQSMFDIEETKAPGPNETSAFVKKACNCIGPDITTAMLDFFQSGKLLKQVKATTLCLLPKCE